MTVKQNIIAGWIAHAVTLLIGFFLMPYILRTLGDSRYGAWLFINAIAGYSGLVYAGFGATICRYVADLCARQDWVKLNKVVSTIQSIYCGSALLVLVLTAVFAWLVPTLDKLRGLPAAEIQLSILILGISIAAGLICSVYGGILVGTQRLDIKRGIEVVLGLLRLGLVLTFLQQRQGLVTLAGIFCTVTILEQALFLYFAYRQIPRLSVGLQHVDRVTLRECFGFSVFNAVAQVAEQLIYFTDTVVIGLMLGPIAVVPYQIALRVAQMIQAPIAQIGEAVLPKAGALHAQNAAEGLRRMVLRGMHLSFLLAASFYIGGVYFGGLLIEVWIGRSFAISENVLCILLGAQVVALPLVIVRKTLLGMGQVRVTAFIDLLEAAINLVLSLLLIQWWGVVGVAWGTFLPLVSIEMFVLLPYAARRFGLTAQELLAGVVKPAIVPLLALLAYCEILSRFPLAPGWITLLAVTTGGGLAWGFALFLTYQLPHRWRFSQSEVLAQ